MKFFSYVTIQNSITAQKNTPNYNSVYTPPTTFQPTFHDTLRAHTSSRSGPKCLLIFQLLLCLLWFPAIVEMDASKKWHDHRKKQTDEKTGINKKRLTLVGSLYVNALEACTSICNSQENRIFITSTQ
jgi:hypothetical protein